MKPPKNIIRIGFLLPLCAALSFGLGACSSSNKGGEEGDLASDEIPELDAGTDAVPIGELEQIEGGLDAPAETAGSDGLTAPPAETPPAETAVADPLAAPESTETAPPADAAPPTDVAQAEPAPAPVETVSEPVADTSASSSQGGSWSGGSESYQVQAGDTLMKIAFETYGDLYQWKKIFEWNRDKISDPNSVPPGVSLKLEKPSYPVAIERNGDKYLIKLGDTLGTISDDIYGTKTKWRKLWENNRQMIKDPNRIFAGFYLYYTMTPEERDEADRLKQQKGISAPPLAGGPEAPVTDERAPASAGG